MEFFVGFFFGSLFGLYPYAIHLLIKAWRERAYQVKVRKTINALNALNAQPRMGTGPDEIYKEARR